MHQRNSASLLSSRWCKKILDRGGMQRMTCPHHVPILRTATTTTNCHLHKQRAAPFSKKWSAHLLIVRIPLHLTAGGNAHSSLPIGSLTHSPQSSRTHNASRPKDLKDQCHSCLRRTYIHTYIHLLTAPSRLHEDVRDASLPNHCDACTPPPCLTLPQTSETSGMPD